MQLGENDVSNVRNGTIHSFNGTYGWIISDGQRYFFHKRNVVEETNPRKGFKTVFKIRDSNLKTGKVEAYDVRVELDIERIHARSETYIGVVTYFDKSRNFGFITTYSGESYHTKTSNIYFNWNDSVLGRVVLFEPKTQKRNNAVKCTKISSTPELIVLIEELSCLDTLVLEGLTLRAPSGRKTSLPFGGCDVLYLAGYQCLKQQDTAERIAALGEVFDSVLSKGLEEDFTKYLILKIWLLFKMTLRRDYQFVFSEVMGRFKEVLAQSPTIWKELLLNGIRKPSTVEDYAYLYFSSKVWSSKSESENFFAQLDNQVDVGSLSVDIVSRSAEYSGMERLEILSSIFERTETSSAVREHIKSEIDHWSKGMQLNAWIKGVYMHLTAQDIVNAYRNTASLASEIIIRAQRCGQAREFFNVLVQTYGIVDEDLERNVFLTVAEEENILPELLPKLESKHRVLLWLKHATETVDLREIYDVSASKKWKGEFSLDRVLERLKRTHKLTDFIVVFIDQLGTIHSGYQFELVKQLLELNIDDACFPSEEKQRIVERMSQEVKVRCWFEYSYIRVEIEEINQHFAINKDERAELLRSCHRDKRIVEFFEYYLNSCTSDSVEPSVCFEILYELVDGNFPKALLDELLDVGRRFMSDEFEYLMFWKGRIIDVNSRFLNEVLERRSAQIKVSMMVAELVELIRKLNSDSLIESIVESTFESGTILNREIRGNTKFFEEVIIKVSVVKREKLFDLLFDLPYKNFYALLARNVEVLKKSRHSKHSGHTLVEIMHRDREYFDWMRKHGHFDITDSILSDELIFLQGELGKKYASFEHFLMYLDRRVTLGDEPCFMEMRQEVQEFMFIRSNVLCVTDSVDEFEDRNYLSIPIETSISLILDGAVDNSLSFQKALSAQNPFELDYDIFVAIDQLESINICQLLLYNMLMDLSYENHITETARIRINDLISNDNIDFLEEWYKSTRCNDELLILLWLSGLKVNLEFEILWEWTSKNLINSENTDWQELNRLFMRLDPEYKRLFYSRLFELEWDRLFLAQHDIVSWVRFVNQVCHECNGYQLEESIILEKIKNSLLRLDLLLGGEIAYFDYYEYTRHFNELNNEQRRLFRSLAEKYMRQIILDEQMSKLTPWKVIRAWENDNGDACKTFSATWRSIFFMSGEIAFCTDRDLNLSKSYPFEYSDARFNYLSDYLVGRKLGALTVLVVNDEIYEVSDLSILEEVLFKADIERNVRKRTQGVHVHEWDVRIPENMIIRNECLNYLTNSQIKGLEPTLITEFARGNFGKERLLETSFLYSIPLASGKAAVVWESCELHKSKATHVFQSENYNLDDTLSTIRDFINGTPNVRSTLQSKKIENIGLRESLNYLGHIRHSNFEFMKWQRELSSYFPELGSLE